MMLVVGAVRELFFNHRSVAKVTAPTYTARDHQRTTRASSRVTFIFSDFVVINIFPDYNEKNRPPHNQLPVRRTKTSLAVRPADALVFPCKRTQTGGVCHRIGADEVV